MLNSAWGWMVTEQGAVVEVDWEIWAGARGRARCRY
jgi:hypothetical protein